MRSEGSFLTEIRSLRRLWQLAGARRRDLALSVLFRCLQSSALGLAWLAAIWLITGLMQGREMTTAWALQLSAMAAASVLGQLFFSYLTVSRGWEASFEVARSLRLHLLEHLGRLPMGFHLSRHSGDSATLLTTDIAMIESFLSDAMAKIIQAVMLPLVLVLALASMAPGLAAALPLSIFIAVPFVLWVGGRFAWIGFERQNAQALAGSVMIEYVQGIRVLRAFNRIAEEQESFARAIDRFRDLSVQMVLLLAFPMVTYAAVLMLGVPVLATVLGLTQGAFEPAVQVTALVLVFSIYWPLVGLVSIMERIRITDASLARLDEVLSAEPLPQRPIETPDAGLLIEFDQVSFGYGEDTPQVLHEVSFKAPARSMTAIVGPSGSGKSTILNLLARFWDVDQGAVRIGGADLRAIEPEHLASLISVVFQDVHLFSGSIRDNIAVGDSARNQDQIEAAAKRAWAHEFISALPQGYDTKLGEGGARLSGGERQRIAIARAMLKDAPIILLDEATAALDPSNERAIQAALSELVADKTLLVVAHKLSTIEAADQILVLSQGRIVERGTHAELAGADGLYARMHDRKSSAESWRIA